MKIVVVGQGGREHALVWRLAREGHEVVALPGNPGMVEATSSVAVDLNDVQATARACRELSPALVVVGPEAPLAAGLVDVLHALRIEAFGPGARATRIESSKAYAKDLMIRAGIPTARFVAVTTPAELDGALGELGGAVAVKADGLAAGKGVVVCDNVNDARAAGRMLLERGPVIVEERLTGPELSVIALCDGKHATILPPARDHKRLLDGDRGPNTGGMGTVAPVPVTESLLSEIRETVIAPTLRAMAEEDAPFTGALFAGLMLTPKGPRVLEFNARFGDPETQSIVGVLGPDVNLGQLMLDAAQGRLSDGVIPAQGAACTVVVAAEGYPDKPVTGVSIEGLDAAKALGARVFHAGTKRGGGGFVTGGGRVLGVMSQGANIAEARQRALAATRAIRFAGAQFRTDIGATSE